MQKSTAQLQPKLELAEILRQHGADYCTRHPLSPAQARVLRHLTQCRTAALGGHVDSCTRCGFARISYNSCRDRHCPKCQALARAEWLEARLERLLPVPYFHVVFTVPDILNPLFLQNQRELYALLFQCTAETLLTIAGDPQLLGAQIGFTAILHTWGQNLLFHPHLHCVVTGGGLSPDGQRWVAARPRFFLPVKVLGRLFRGKFLAGLRKLRDKGQLQCKGSTAPLSEDRAWRRWIAALYKLNWVVYAKPPFGGPQQVFRYLGRYSHRVAISNARLLEMEKGKVSFWYKDYADEHKSKVMRLEAEEFIRRFLLHVLPKGFTRIRHYGLAASRQLHANFARCQTLLGAQGTPIKSTVAETAFDVSTPTKCPTWVQRMIEWTGQDPLYCPRCQTRLSRCELPSFRRAQSHLICRELDSS